MRILVTQDQDSLRPRVEAGVTCQLGRIVLLGDVSTTCLADDVSLHLTEQLVDALLSQLRKPEDPLAYLATELRPGV